MLARYELVLQLAQMYAGINGASLAPMSINKFANIDIIPIRAGGNYVGWVTLLWLIFILSTEF